MLNLSIEVSRKRMNRSKALVRKNTFEKPYTLKNSAEWIAGGAKFFERLVSLIDSAKLEIHLQTYIFENDKTSILVADALLRAASRNVDVFIFVDAYGSQNLSSALIARFTNSGIHFKKFGTFYSKGKFHIGRRMHHKVVVIDGITAIVGGINISDNYNDTPGNPAWLDFAAIMQGDISRRIQFFCRKSWSGSSISYRNKKKLLKNVSGELTLNAHCPIRVRRNDFVRNRNDIAISYREAFRRAEKSLLIVGGYFLPGGRTRRLMKKAIQRGVKIDVIVSEKSDVHLLVNARRFLYAWLIRNGVGVHEYKWSNVHGKVIVMDEKWTSIGSFDLNNLSTYSNIELNVDLKDIEFSSGLSRCLKNIISKDCNEISKEKIYSNRSLFSKFKMWISYRFVKTLFVLSVLLSGKRERDF
jgi:cardiolipin synthase